MKSRVWRWTAIAAGCALLAMGIRAFWLEPASLTVVEERISLRWPMRGPVRIAILTDLHIGSPFNGPAKLRVLVDRTNAVRPDVVCILGDLVVQGVIGGRFVAPERIAAELRRLQAPAGVFAVLGNHDGWLDHDRVRNALQENGIHVVEETAERVDTPAGPLWIAGISDLWTGRHDIPSALSAVQPDGAPIILLTHNPDVFPDVPDDVALTLAGHTHGGQVRLPFVGRPVVPSRFGQRFAAGHVVEVGRHLFVATGVGTSILPVRFGVPPAVTILTVEPDGARDPRSRSVPRATPALWMEHEKPRVQARADMNVMNMAIVPKMTANTPQYSGDVHRALLDVRQFEPDRPHHIEVDPPARHAHDYGSGAIVRVTRRGAGVVSGCGAVAAPPRRSTAAAPGRRLRAARICPSLPPRGA